MQVFIPPENTEASHVLLIEISEQKRLNVERFSY